MIMLIPAKDLRNSHWPQSSLKTQPQASDLKGQAQGLPGHNPRQGYSSISPVTPRGYLSHLCQPNLGWDLPLGFSKARDHPGKILAHR